MSAKWKKSVRTSTLEPQAEGQCKCCGSCCAFISIPPFKEDELDRIPADIRAVVAWYTQHQPKRPETPSPCYFYDATSRLCLIHEHKPQTCRDFVPAGPACRNLRSNLLDALNAHDNAACQWSRHYTRVVLPGRRIQEIAEFAVDAG
jgi:Fe-S-cluster containining protein